MTYYDWQLKTKQIPKPRVSKRKPKITKKAKVYLVTTKAKPSKSKSNDVEVIIKVKKRVPIRITRDDDDDENRMLLKNRTTIMNDLSKRQLTLDDLRLDVKLNAGTYVERDVTCDSDFMLDHIHEMGESIRRAYDKVTTRDKPIVLIMDNAGGHGSKDVKKDYERILRDDYKVVVHWQIANSPETNLLDLSAWMALQSIVEKKHRLLVKDKNSLSNTV